MSAHTAALTANTKGDPRMHVALAANRNWLMPLAVTLRSVDVTHVPGEVEVTVLHDRLSKSDRASVEFGLSGLDVTWLQVPLERLSDARFPTVLSQASLFRILLPELLPSTMNRILYLDADTIITASLRPLWETKLANHCVAAVRDAGNPFAAGPSGPDWRALGLEADDPYFNSGVLLMALDTWRATGVSQHALELLRGTTLRWGDQDALNVALRGRWKELPRRWNLQTMDVAGAGLSWALWRADVQSAVQDAGIIHYTEYSKPWFLGNQHPLRSRWFDLLEGTSWSDWRPDATPRPLYRRMGTRAKSAWRALTASPPSAQVPVG